MAADASFPGGPDRHRPVVSLLHHRGSTTLVGMKVLSQRSTQVWSSSQARRPAALLFLLPALSLLLPGSAHGGSELRRVNVPEYRGLEEVTLDIGQLISTGAVQPRPAISVDQQQAGSWVLRTPKGPPALRWYRNLLNASVGAPDLVIDPGLKGTYDIHVEVRAVNAGGASGAIAKPEDVFPMTFALELDDGSQREIVGAKGFPAYHYDTEVLAGYQWQLDHRKLVVRNLGKPVYLYGFHFVPSKTAPAGRTGTEVSRWLASDHVTIVKEPEKHFAFPSVALLKNGDLAVVYREGTIHGHEAIGKVSLSRSKDRGRTWLPRVTALDRAGVDDRDPTIFQMSDGTVLLVSSDCLCTSVDFGQTWSTPLPTPVFGPKGAVEDEEGNIVYGGLRRVVQDRFTVIAGRPAQLQANSVYRSRDKGRSWELVGIGTYTLYKEGPLDYVWYDEPFLCVVPGKYWIFTSRVDLDGYARITRSVDRGRTWEPISKTPVWGYPQHLLPLRDGRLLMTYGYRRPPWGVRACLSHDQGKTWDIQNEIILRMDGGTLEGQKCKVGNGDLGYPVSVQLADGTIFTVYYLNQAGSNCFIAGTFWQLPAR